MSPFSEGGIYMSMIINELSRLELIFKVIERSLN